MSKGPRPVSSALRSWSRPNTAVATSSSLTRDRVWDGADGDALLCGFALVPNRPTPRSRAVRCPFRKFVLAG